MSSALIVCAELARRLRDDVDSLAGAAAVLEVDSPTGAEWYGAIRVAPILSVYYSFAVPSGRIPTMIWQSRTTPKPSA